VKLLRGMRYITRYVCTVRSVWYGMSKVLICGFVYCGKPDR